MKTKVKRIATVLFVLILLGACKKNPDSSNNGNNGAKPHASFSYSTSCGTAPSSMDADDTIRFKCLDTLATAYFWDFGDGTTSIDSAPSHTFNKSGLLSVKLRTTNGSGTDSTTIQITLQNPFRGSFRIPSANSTVYVDDSVAYAPGSIVYFNDFPPPYGSTRVTITSGRNFVIPSQTVYVVTGSPNTPATITGHGRLEGTSCTGYNIYMADTIIIQGGPVYHQGLDTLVGQ